MRLYTIIMIYYDNLNSLFKKANVLTWFWLIHYLEMGMCLLIFNYSLFGKQNVLLSTNNSLLDDTNETC